jgi:predicted enzyme related to lactoylglutathione lyase
MPQREESPIGAPCWIDLMSSDPDLATPFYTGLFGWSSERSGEEFNDYITFYLDGRAVAGLMKAPEDAAQDCWTTYFRVSGIEEVVANAEKAGATVHLPPHAAGETGTFAILGDPAGAVFGLWEPDQHVGFEVVNEPGAPVWTELATTDFEGAQSFYASVFGWNYQPLDGSAEFQYVTIHTGEDEPIGGILDAAKILDRESPRWQTYLGTADTDAIVAQAVDFGGKVLEEPSDSEHGRIARIADPTGSPLMLCSVSLDPTADEIAPG